MQYFDIHNKDLKLSFFLANVLAAECDLRFNEKSSTLPELHGLNNYLFLQTAVTV